MGCLRIEVMGLPCQRAVHQQHLNPHSERRKLRHEQPPSSRRFQYKSLKAMFKLFWVLTLLAIHVFISGDRRRVWCSQGDVEEELPGTPSPTGLQIEWTDPVHSFVTKDERKDYFRCPGITSNSRRITRNLTSS